MASTSQNKEEVKTENTYTADELVKAIMANQKDTVVTVERKDSDVVREAEQDMRKKQMQRAKFINFLREDSENHVLYTIPKIYKRYVGDLTIGLNHAIIKIKADGNPVKVHKSFVPVVEAKLRYYDDKISTMQENRGEDIRMLPDNNLNNY